MTRLRVGVVGCGAIAQIQHLPHLRDGRDRFEIGGICDIAPDLLRKVGDDFHVPQDRRASPTSTTWWPPTSTRC